MIDILKKDILSKPRLFFFSEGVPEDIIFKNIFLINIDVPSELIELWKEIGGGEMYETETILSPVKNGDLGDDIESVNNYHYSKGLSKDFLIFHVGLGGLSAVLLKSENYYILDDVSYKHKKQYHSLKEWYEEHIRKAYEGKYLL